MFKVTKTGDDVIDVINIFHTFSGVSVVDFEQVNVSWGIMVNNPKQPLHARKYFKSKLF